MSLPNNLKNTVNNYNLKNTVKVRQTKSVKQLELNHKQWLSQKIDLDILSSKEIILKEEQKEENIKLKFKKYRTHFRPLVKEGQIWWCHLGQNIGNEIFGRDEKNNKFYYRSVLVFKKFSDKIGLVIPLTTKDKSIDKNSKTEVPIKLSWYTPITFQGEKFYAVLSQVKTIDFTRFNHLSKNMGKVKQQGEIDEKDFEKITQDLHKLLFNKQ
jgi:uncharacterized protein YifN (PemK superfamily)